MGRLDEEDQHSTVFAIVGCFLVAIGIGAGLILGIIIGFNAVGPIGVVPGAILGVSAGLVVGVILGFVFAIALGGVFDKSVDDE